MPDIGDYHEARNGIECGMAAQGASILTPSKVVGAIYDPNVGGARLFLMWIN